MVLDPVANFGKVTVSIGYDAAATSIVLSSGDGARLPSTFSYNLTWWNATDYADPADDPNREIVRVTNRVSDTLTVTRGQEGTSASIKNVSGKTYKMVLAVTKKLVDDIDTRLPTESSANQFRTFHANKSGDQTIPPSTETKVTFTNEVFDTGGDYDAPNSKFIPVVAGKYFVHAILHWTSPAASSGYRVILKKNGVTQFETIMQADSSAAISVSICGIVSLNGSTDFIECYAQHNAGTSKDISGSSAFTYWNAFRIQ